MTPLAISFLLACAIIVCFVFVLLFGAPFLPTLRTQIETALNLLDLRPGETMLELGCGDGRVMIAAARRGLFVVGYELNPILFLIAWIRTRRYHKQVRVVLGDFWSISWPSAAGIFGFILPRYMSKLDKKIAQYKQRPLRVASFAFTIPQKKAKTMKDGVYLYEYKS